MSASGSGKVRLSVSPLGTLGTAGREVSGFMPARSSKAERLEMSTTVQSTVAAHEGLMRLKSAENLLAPPEPAPVPLQQRLTMSAEKIKAKLGFEIPAEYGFDDDDAGAMAAVQVAVLAPPPSEPPPPPLASRRSEPASAPAAPAAPLATPPAVVPRTDARGSESEQSKRKPSLLDNMLGLFGATVPE